MNPPLFNLKDQDRGLPPITANTIHKGLCNTIRNHGEKTALILHDRELTYRQLGDNSLAISKGLMAIGLKPGDHVALCMPNNEFFVTSFLGITSVGCVMVPMNTRYRAREMSYILRNSDARALITVDRFLNTDHLGLLEEAFSELDGLEKVIVVGETRPLPGVETYSFADLFRIGNENENIDISLIAPKVRPDTTAMILYTSGTTGAPKGAMLTHENVCTNAWTAGEVMNASMSDRYFVPLPLFHVFGLVLGCLTPILFGASIVLMEVFTARDALRLMERHRCTMNFGVPAMFIMELDELERERYELSSLRSGIMGGAPCPMEIVKGTMERMGCDIRIGYGITETSPLITLTRFDDPPETRAKTVGSPIPGVRVEIVDDGRKKLPIGAIGEIAIRGNNMKGYYKMPERTKDVLDENGWYYSGDLGKVDEDGNVSVTGRKKDMIIVGGFNVYPREVEEFIFTHPSVQNAAVVGAAHPTLGELVYAYVILKEGRTATEEEIIAYLTGKMANFKVPRHVEFVKEYPMTQSGKVRKFVLRERAAESLKKMDTRK